MSVLLGVLFLGAAWALARGWSLIPLGVYAFFPGVAAVVIGVRIIHLSLTLTPLLSGAGFILTGSGGVFAGLALCKCRIKALRIIGGLVMLAAVAIWTPTTYMAYWYHMLVKPQPQNASTLVQPSRLLTPPTDSPKASGDSGSS